MADFEFVPTARDEGRVGELVVETADGETHRFDVGWDDMLALQEAFADRELEIRGRD